MRAPTLIEDDLECLSDLRRELKEREARLFSEARDHPQIQIDDAARLAKVSRVTAYERARGHYQRV